MAKKLSDYLKLNPSTQKLLFAVVQDVYPDAATCVAFGIASAEHFEALYHPLKRGEISREQLDQARGDGAKLTALVNGASSNPHKDILFTVAQAARQEAQQQPGKAKDRDRGMER